MHRTMARMSRTWVFLRNTAAARVAATAAAGCVLLPALAPARFEFSLLSETPKPLVTVIAPTVLGAAIFTSSRPVGGDTAVRTAAVRVDAWRVMWCLAALAAVVLSFTAAMGTTDGWGSTTAVRNTLIGFGLASLVGLGPSAPQLRSPPWRSWRLA